MEREPDARSTHSRNVDHDKRTPSLPAPWDLHPWAAAEHDHSGSIYCGIPFIPIIRYASISI